MPIAVPTQEETLHWIALQMVPGLGTISSLKLLKTLKSPQEIFRASASEFEALGSVRPRPAMSPAGVHSMTLSINSRS